MGTIKLNKSSGVDVVSFAEELQMILDKKSAKVSIQNIVTKFDENLGWSDNTESESSVSVVYGVYEDEYEEGQIDYNISPTLIDGTITNIILKLYCRSGEGLVSIGNKAYNFRSGEYLEISNGTKLNGSIFFTRTENEYINATFDFVNIIVRYVSNSTGEDSEVVEESDINEKKIILAGGVKGYLNLNTGAFGTVFSSFDKADFALPLSIAHIHKMEGGTDYCGANWSLNLERKLIPPAKDALVTDYTYIDEFRNKHKLKETYYYFENGVQQYISKSLITVDLNGELFYNGKKVYKKQSCGGLVLIPQIRDFINSEYIEQRTDNQIQIDNYLKQMRATLVSYVRSNKKGAYGLSSGNLTKENVDRLFSGVDETSDTIIITEAEALQLQMLWLEYMKDGNDAANNQINYIVRQARANLEFIKEAFTKYFAKEAEKELLEKQTPVNYLKDEEGIISGFNANGDLVLLCDAYNNYVTIVYNADNRISEIYDDKGRTFKFEYADNLLNSITDNRGRKITYSYSGNKLYSVSFPDERKLFFEYSSGFMRSVKSNDGTQSTITRESGTDHTTKIVNKATDSNGTIEHKITVEYGDRSVTLTNSDGGSESYEFDNSFRVVRHKTVDGLLMPVDERYTYEKTGKSGETVTCVRNDVNGSDTTIKTYDDFGRIDRDETDWKALSDNVDTKSTTEYRYDLDGNLIFKKTCVEFNDKSEYDENREFNDDHYEYLVITNYSYNAQGSLTLTESYVLGEEEKAGKNYEERIYDENGNVIKTICWNSLDSSSKFYNESVCAENGQVAADKDETGEVCAEYEYLDGTNVVNSVTYPNGSKFAYGRNPYNYAVTSVTQSTDDGEANTTDVCYNNGLPVRVSSGNTVIEYEYDGDGRKTCVKVNGNQQYAAKYKTEYKYYQNEDEASFGYVTETYGSGEDAYTVTTEKYGPIDEDTGTGKMTETITVNKTKVYEKRHNGYGNLTYVANGNSEVNFLYLWGRDLTSAEIRMNGLVILNENYTFNDYKELTKKELTGAVTQTYSYAYKINAARDLDYISFGEYKFKPLTDVNGRSTGKEIYRGENKVAGEYITYRKVGDHATNMPATVWFGNGEKIAESIKYKYDTSGNISEITENGHVTAKYAYDSLNRLIREDNKAIGKTIIFAYDNAGNITERCEYEYTRKSGEELTEHECTHYSYDYDGDKLKSYNGESFAYNGLGCPATYRGKTATWQYGKLLASYNGISFTYNGLGSRASKGNIEFTYDSDGKLIKQSNGLEFVYDNAGVIGVKYGGVQYFYRKDAQGNIIAILDNVGKVVVKYLYDAWGNHAVVDGDGNDVISGIGVLNPIRYRGYYYDTETELYYLQTRYYDPEIGRFISQDSIEYADPETINGLNLYAYCGNNPVMGYDPNGNWNWGIFASVVMLIASFALTVAGAVLTVTGVGTPVGAILLGAGIGGLIGMGGSVVSQAISGGWSNVNWGQVAFNGATGAVIGGLMASPLGGIATGIAIGGIGIIESVGNDLFENNFEWKQVEWGKAIITGVVMGGVSGVGKIFVNIGNSIAYGIDKFTRASLPVANAAALIGNAVALGSKFITSGIRFILKSITQQLKW